MQRKNKLLVLVALISFFNLFLFHKFGNLGFVIFCLGLFLFLAFVFHGKNLRSQIKYLLLFCLFLSPLLFRANDFVIFCFVMFSFVFLCSYFYISAYRLNFFRSWLELIFSPLGSFGVYLKSSLLTYVFPENHTEKPKRNEHSFKPFLRGVLFALPVIFILVVMLSTADPIYNKLVGDLINQIINLSPNLIQRIIFSAVLFLIFLPVIYLKKKEIEIPISSAINKLAFISEMTVVASFVVLVLGSFLIIQFRYIFASVPFETSLVQFGVKTYSEYVRRGFVELIFVAGFVYSLIWLGLLIIRSSKNHRILSLKVLQVVVLGELLIFIASLFRRIYLYYLFHGWSVVRIYGIMFLVWLTVMILTLFARHISQKKWFIKEIIFTCFCLLVFGFFNAEEFLATSSHLPTVNGRVDYVYLSRLSADGFSGWKKAFTWAREILDNRTLQAEEIISKDERRDVIYAGFVVDNLFKEYHHQILTYGTNDEARDYYLFLISNDDDTSDSKQKTIDALKNTRNLDGIKANINIISPNTFLPTMSSCVSGRRFYVINYDSLSLRPISKSFLDELFVWNLGSKGSVIKMMKEINLSDLLSLQEKYCFLNQKILRQPAGERDFEFDISLSSPFVE